MSKSQPPKQEIATTKENLPVVSAQDQKQMYGELDASDIIVPRITVLQGLSPEVNEGLGTPGNFFVQGLNIMLGKKFEFIVLMRNKTRIRWLPINEGGGILCRSFDAKRGEGNPGGECEKCALKDWAGTTAPACDVYENVIVMLRGSDDQIPMVLSGSRTKLKSLKQLNTLLMMQMQKQRPLYMKSYVASAVEKTNKGGLKYWSLSFSVGNNNSILPQVEIDSAAAMFETLKNRKLIIDQENDNGSSVAANEEI